MKRVAASILFLGCLAWIAASCVLADPAASRLAAWDWIAAAGALIAFLEAIA